MTGTLTTAAIVAGGAVLAAVLSNLGNYWLERSKRGATDRRWLLDRRHQDVVHFLSQANICSRELQKGPASNGREAAIRSAEEAYLSARITSSAEVEALIDSVYDALADLADAETSSSRQEARDVVGRRIAVVLTRARLELQPPSAAGRLRVLEAGRRRGAVPDRAA